MFVCFQRTSTNVLCRTRSILRYGIRSREAGKIKPATSSRERHIIFIAALNASRKSESPRVRVK